MDMPTLLEVEAKRDAVASVLDPVPGVAVSDDAVAAPSPPAGPDGADSSGPGRMDRLKSLWRQWGLLGTGLSLIALGAAAAGLWWYRRPDESSDESDGSATERDTASTVDTPVPPEPTVDTPLLTDSGVEPTAPAGEADDAPTLETTSALGPTPGGSEGRQPDTDSERADAAEAGTEVDAPNGDGTAPDGADTDDQPEAEIDPAPLLGAAFLVVTSAIGRWVTRNRHDET